MLISKKIGTIKTTEICKSNDTGNFLFIQWDTVTERRTKIVIIDPQQAIEIAISILKIQGVIPQKTTIEQLEQQGKI